MVFIVKVIDGVKKIIPVTADAGAGNPVGSYLYLEKKSNPQGYLYCDGSTFDETKYPLLYAYLGSNVLPDWREFSAVGAEENTTSSVIATHDVYTQGQEKDDQLQEHTHSVDSTISYATNAQAGNTLGVRETSSNTNTNASTIISGRAGTVTRGKRKAVFIYIKATSGLSENAQDNVINTLNEQRSYSTEEHLTGKKWIDGKPIYEKSFICSTSNTILSNSIGGARYSFTGTENIAQSIDTLVATNLIKNKKTTFSIDAYISTSSPIDVVLCNYTTHDLVTEVNNTILTLEYTKTTD